jgi:O-antigen/teichoic acid export membrane protein
VVESLKSKAVRGIAWTASGQVARQVMQVATLLILGRLLTPSDFGLVGMAMFFVGIGQLIAEFGMGAAVVQSQTTSQRVLSSCFWLNAAIAAGMCLMLVASAPLVGRFYERADLVPVVVVLAFTLLLNALHTVPAALIYRSMRFGELARAQLIGTFLGSVSAIALALSGAGVWSLVVQSLVGSSATLLAYLRTDRWLPRLEYSWQDVKPLARFSGALFGTKMLDHVQRNAESVLVGRVLGAQQLGLYTMAMQIILYPLQQVSSTFVKVLVPVLIALRDEPNQMQAAYLKSVAGIALVSFPLMGGLFALADDFVIVTFGPAWAEMVPLLKLLAWVGMAQSVGTAIGTLYVSTGNATLALKVTAITTPLLIGGVAAGLPWGTLGVAVGYAAVYFPIFVGTMIVGFRLIGLRVSAFAFALARPLACTLVMTLVLGSDVWRWTSEPASRLAVSIAAGALIYVVASLLFNRAQLVEIVALVRSLRIAQR